jgi:hypothetical protein
MNEDLKYILAHPGKYAMQVFSYIDVRHAYVMVEVDSDGTIYQLNQLDERDGVLALEKFNPLVRFYVTSKSENTFVRVGLL